MRFLSAVFRVAWPAVFTAHEADVKKPKDDVDRIGDPGVGKGVNFTSSRRKSNADRRLAKEYKPLR